MYTDDSKVEALGALLAEHAALRSASGSRAFLIRVGLLTPLGKVTAAYQDVCRPRNGLKARRHGKRRSTLARPRKLRQLGRFGRSAFA